MASLAVHNLSITVNKNEILKNISIRFREGKRTAIIGPNGCGKSTLLRVVSGLSRDYGGEVLLDGADMKKLPRRAIAEKLAILPQGVSAPADLTVKDLVTYGRFPYRSLFKSAAKEDAEIVAQAMEKMRVSHLQSRLVATLSGGERQRAWIAMALAQQPQILLLDEPTTYLDIARQRAWIAMALAQQPQILLLDEPTTYLDIAHQLEIMQIVAELNTREGMTVIMVLHDINHARLYADDVVIIKNKGVFAAGEPQKVITPDTLGEVFGVEAAVYKNCERQAEEVIFPFVLRR